MTFTPVEIVTHDIENFLTLGGLTIEAGCDARGLPRLAVKELIDNAFDYPSASYSSHEGCFFSGRIETKHSIRDHGPGLSEADILRLFSLQRPMSSTKRWRRAGRGALGNGLRVVCAAVRLLRLVLIVQSRDGEFILTFDEIGETHVERTGEPLETGTLVEIYVPGVQSQADRDFLASCTFAPGAIYDGPASPHAFGMMDFRGLCRKVSHLSIREFSAQFGYDIADDNPLSGVADDGLKELHLRLKKRTPKAITLPGMGEGIAIGEDGDCHYYSEECRGMVAVDGGGLIPATVEAWVYASRTDDCPTDLVSLWMNRTSSVTMPSAASSSGYIFLDGCGLRQLAIKAGGARTYFEIKLAITTSYFDMSAKGKAPLLGPFSDLIKKAVRAAAKLAYDYADLPEKVEKKQREERKMNPVEASYAVMEDAARHATSSFMFPAKPHQLWYPAVAMMKERFADEPKIMAWINKPNNVARNRFVSVHLKDYQLLHDTSHWPVVDIDSRGSASEPHDGRKNIQLSTSEVSKYCDPARSWEKNFGAVLYVEKEQFGFILEPVLNEFDIEIIESKGQGTIGEKEMLLWAESQGLPVLVFTDCDVAGFMIYRTIVKGTDYAKPVPTARRIGLTLEQAQAFNLTPEPKIPCDAHQTWLATNSALVDADARKFLLTHRFELNHLNTEQMRELLRSELTALGIAKVMPPPDSLMKMLAEEAVERARDIFDPELEEKLDEVRAAHELKICDHVQGFANAILESTSEAELQERTRTLMKDERKGSPWQTSFSQVANEIISEPLEEFEYECE